MHRCMLPSFLKKTIVQFCELVSRIHSSAIKCEWSNSSQLTDERQTRKYISTCRQSNHCITALPWEASKQGSNSKITRTRACILSYCCHTPAKSDHYWFRRWKFMKCSDIISQYRSIFEQTYVSCEKVAFPGLFYNHTHWSISSSGAGNQCVYSRQTRYFVL